MNEFSQQRIALINPALNIPACHIDNPAFVFYAPLSIYNILDNAALDICYFDAFSEGEINIKGNRVVLGTPNSKLIPRVLDAKPQVALIHTSSFIRAEGLYNNTLNTLINQLHANNIEIVLADMYDSSTHYLDYNREILLNIYPSVSTVLQKYFPISQLIGPEKYQKMSTPIISHAEKYFTFLGQAVKKGLLKDTETLSSIFPYVTSTGCPYNCLFCKKKGERQIEVPLENVFEDLQYLSGAGIRCVYIMDPYANFNTPRFKKIIAHCASLGLQTHHTNGIGLAHLDDESASLLSRVERDLFISPESLFDTSLKHLRKPFSREVILEKLEILKRYNISSNAHFILNIPRENRQSINKLFTDLGSIVENFRIKPYFQIFNSLKNLFINQKEISNVYEKFFPQLHQDMWIQTAHENFIRRFDAKDQRKIIINVTYRCNNQCSFCAIADREQCDGDFIQQKNLIDYAYSRGIRLLDIDGGEPLLYERLFDILDAATNYNTITITTNGRLLADPGIAEKLSAYLNVHILVSLHSASQTIQNSLTNSNDSFSQTIAGIKNAVKLFPGIGINTTLTSENYHTMVETATLSCELGAASFNIQWYTPFGKVDKSLVPPDEAIDHVRNVIDAYEKKMRISLINFQYCQAPDLASYMYIDYYKIKRNMLFVNGEIVNLSDYLATKRYKTSDCGICAYNCVCQGFWSYEADPNAINKIQTVSSHPSVLPETMKTVSLLDIIPGYACNRRCIFCTAENDLRKVNLDTKTLMNRLEDALERYKPERVRIGGGEPTIRKDLFKIIRYVKSHYIDSISIQSNGLMLSYKPFVDKLLDAGVNKINLSIPGYKKELVEYLTGTPGSFELILKGLNNCTDANIIPEMDILLNKTILNDLESMIAFYKERDVRNFNLWYISIDGNVKERIGELVPRLSETALKVNQLIDASNEVTIRVYYIPYCFFPNNLNKVWHPLEENTLVITPDTTFTLDRGEIDIGQRTGSCNGCVLYEKCFGIRENYVNYFGDSEINPLHTISGT